MLGLGHGDPAGQRAVPPVRKCLSSPLEAGRGFAKGAWPKSAYRHQCLRRYFTLPAVIPSSMSRRRKILRLSAQYRHWSQPVMVTPSSNLLIGQGGLQVQAGSRCACSLPGRAVMITAPPPPRSQRAANAESTQQCPVPAAEVAWRSKRRAI